jgi:hypothetical protein
MTKTEQLEQRLAQIKAQLQAEKVREAKKERADRTRYLIRLGALLVADDGQKTLLEKYKKQIEAQDEKYKKEKAKKEKKQPETSA